MKSKTCKILVLTVVLLISAVAASVQTQFSAGQPQEYQVKAAFLFNFIRFVDWPNERKNDSNEPIFMGIIGNDPFGDAFEPSKSKPVKGRKIVLNRFKNFAELEKSGELRGEIEIIRRCHLLFICSSEKDNTKDIIKLLDGSPVLTVGETTNLLEAGGIIRLLTEDKKVCFEINLGAAEQVNLRISSQLNQITKGFLRVLDNFQPYQGGLWPP